MARSVAAALRARGISESGAAAVQRALALAMETRVGVLDDHHPAYLHPGRSVLVLLHDVAELDPEALLLAALHESVDDALRIGTDRIRSEIGSPAGSHPGALPVADALAALPLPGDESLEEKLVLLARPSALAVLAERLDHLRHLHLRPELAGVRAARHAEVVRAWQPFAERVDERLAVRYGHWSRTFARRLRRGQLPRV